jgi:hypothetical protein
LRRVNRPFTVLSKAVFDRLHNIALNDTTEVAQDILSAAEEPLKTYGKITLAFSIGNFSFQQPMVIADISVDGILGLDFLHGNRCIVVAMEHGIFKIQF